MYLDFAARLPPKECEAMSAKSQVGRRSVAIKAGLSLTGAMLVCVGCSNQSNQPQVPSTPTGPKAANSVFRESSPQPRSNNLEAQLHSYRTQTYTLLPPALPTVVPPFVQHKDVVYTEAYRHAVYLNSINSGGWSFATPSAPPNAIITPTSLYAALLTEGPVATTGPYPALFTNTTLYPRLEAVVGGRDLMANGGCTSSTVFETYIFDGTIETETTTNSQFRGFTGPNLTTRESFSAVDNAWYTRRGRMLLARPSLFAFGFGQKCDDGSVPCDTIPYPIMNGQFLGVLTTLHQNPLNHVMGFWPNNGNTDVNPYGLDTENSGTDLYVGPPIHITLPLNVSIPRTTGVKELSLTRVDSLGASTAPLTAPSTQADFRSYNVFSGVKGLTVPTVPVANGDFHAVGPIAKILSNVAVDSVNFGGATFRVDEATAINLVVPGQILEVTLSTGLINTYPITAVNTDLFLITVAGPLVGVAADYVPASGVTLAVVGASSRVEATFDPNLLDGEIVIVPSHSLQNLTRYRVQFEFQGPIAGGVNTGLQTFFFTTNANGAYP